MLNQPSFILIDSLERGVEEHSAARRVDPLGLFFYIA